MLVLEVGLVGRGLHEVRVVVEREGYGAGIALRIALHRLGLRQWRPARSRGQPPPQRAHRQRPQRPPQQQHCVCVCGKVSVRVCVQCVSRRQLRRSLSTVRCDEGERVKGGAGERNRGTVESKKEGREDEAGREGGEAAEAQRETRANEVRPYERSAYVRCRVKPRLRALHSRGSADVAARYRGVMERRAEESCPVSQ